MIKLLLFIITSSQIFSATSVSTTITATVGNTTTENISIKNEANQSKIIKYREVSEGTTEIIEWSETLSENNRTNQSISGSYKESTTGINKTERYYYHNESKKTEILVTVSDDIASISSTINSEVNESTVPLNGKSLKYPPGFYMKDFIKSENKKEFIWVVGKTAGKLSQMILTKLGKETITVDDNEIQCVKIEMKPTGMGGMFWKAYYWFDQESLEFVRYFGKKGPPGTPDYTIDKIL